MGRGMSDNDWPGGSPSNATIIYKIGIYGWRKRCLYVFVLLLMVTVTINLALTVWILKVMDFSVDGMGQLHITPKGVRVEGDTEFLEGLYANSVRSRSDEALTVQSARNITLNTRNRENKLTNRLVIGNNKIESYAKRFDIYSTSGNLLFSADKDKLQIGARTLIVPDSSGAVFHGSVQTPSVQSDGENLRIESPTRSLLVSAPEGVTVQAERGPIYINSSMAPIKLDSLDKVTLEAKTIHLKSLKISQPHIVDGPFEDVYQLCICAHSGKLFLAPAQGTCQATSTICD